METKGDRVILTAAEADRMIPQKPMIHTFRQSGPVMLGCGWEREKLLEWIRRHGCELSGELATGMGHGLAGRDETGWMFFETIEGAQPEFDQIAMGA